MNIQEILKKYWGYEDFRGIQRDIIESVCSGHDTLGLMPTGGGKSITFQVPALAMEGVCIVITPLVALMKDQVQHMRRLGIRADAIYGGLSHDEMLRLLDNAILGSTKLLYISPERLSSSLFQTKLHHMRVSFITVDEAHCISQWGYDFRPAYLEIATIRHLLPDTPVLALTATATPQVVNDICEKLTAPNSQAVHHSFSIFRMSFYRDNLSYLVSHTTDKFNELVHLLNLYDGSAIVYVRSRRHAREIADHLCTLGINATYYHAGIDGSEKDRRQHDWQHDTIRVIVATNAFGMGIDKPDVRLVIHYDCPDSPEAYFQEAGRAGRDGLPAQAILLYSSSDTAKLKKRVDDTFPPRDYIRQVYEHLAYFYQIAVGSGYGLAREFDIDAFCRNFHHFPVRVHAALLILQRAGYIDYECDSERLSRVRFLIGRDDLYRLRQMSPDADRVIVALLRLYGGLFADFASIDDTLVARTAGLTPAQTYEILKSLAQRKLIDFIPRSQTPMIRYLQHREDPEHIALPPAVYQERLEQYRIRIQSMIHYACSANRCRSRLLLEYFGESSTHNCGHCDVCQQSKAATPADIETARQAILQLLTDDRLHPLSELRQLPIPSIHIDAALAELIAEEIILQQDGEIKKN